MLGLFFRCFLSLFIGQKVVFYKKDVKSSFGEGENGVRNGGFLVTV